MTYDQFLQKNQANKNNFERIGNESILQVAPFIRSTIKEVQADQVFVSSKTSNHLQKEDITGLITRIFSSNMNHVTNPSKLKNWNAKLLNSIEDNKKEFGLIFLMLIYMNITENT